VSAVSPAFPPGGFALEAAAFGAALLLEVLVGEPPAALHPVCAMGRAVSALERRAPGGAAGRLVYGAGMALLVPGLFAGAAWLLAGAARRLHPAAYILVAGFLLKTSFAARSLAGAARSVARGLRAGDLAGARLGLRALVSRDASGLGASPVASAAVESVAENTTDSFFAPWLAFALLGPAGAVAYRAVNTLDAMIGYRGRYEHLGKASARLDDLLNLVPSRLAAAAFVLAFHLRARCAPERAARRAAGCRAWAVLRRDGRRTASPNAGLTMAAMAGGLGVELEKPGSYRLGAGQRAPGADDIEEAVQMMWIVAAIALPLCLGLLGVRHALG
jgi:adenosylcobinamide-phosphate synthase